MEFNPEEKQENEEDESQGSDGLRDSGADSGFRRTHSHKDDIVLLTWVGLWNILVIHMVCSL